MKISDFSEVATSLLSKMNKTHKEPGNLKECSPWMSEFKAEFLRSELEVPGKFPFSVDSKLSLTRKLLLSFFLVLAIGPLFLALRLIWSYLK